MHLGVAELGPDLLLLEVLEEPHDHRLTLQLAKTLEQVGQGQPVLQLHLAVGGGQQGAEADRALRTDRLVQRQLAAGVDRLEGLGDLLLGDAEVVADLGQGGGAAELGGQAVAGLDDPQGPAP